MKKQGLKRDPIAQAILCKLYAQELKLDRALRYFNDLLIQYPDQRYEDRSGDKPNDKKKKKHQDEDDEDPTANYKIEPMLYILLASVCAINKRSKEAKKILEQLKTRMPDDKMSIENIRDKEQILQYLKTAAEKMEVDGEPAANNKVTAFRDDPRVFIVEEGNEGGLGARLKKELKDIAKKSKLALEVTRLTSKLCLYSQRFCRLVLEPDIGWLRRRQKIRAFTGSPLKSASNARLKSG